MPKVTEPQEARLRLIIRDAIAINPLIGEVELQRIIEHKTNRHMDRGYIRRLTRKVNGEVAVRLDQEKAEKRVAELRETNRIIRNELMRIAFPPDTLTGMDRPTPQQRMKALDLIAKIDRNQVILEMDLGLYTRHLGQLDIDHRLRPLEETQRSSIIQAFKVWDMRPTEPRKVTTVEVKPAETALPQHEPAKQPTGANSSPAKPQPEPIPVAGPEPVVS